MRPGWFNDNSNRDFPFIHETTGVLPDSVIVDFGSLMGLDSTYTVDDSTYLFQISRDDNDFIFDVRTTAAGLSNRRLIFTRNLADEVYGTEHVESRVITDEDEDDTCDAGSLWSGYLVTGDLTELADMISDGGSLVQATEDDLIFEPALTQSLVGSFARSINLANDNRTLIDSPLGCKPICWPNDQDDAVLYVSERCIQGQPRFKEGFNCSIRQSDTDNRIIIGARLGSGAGEPCEEVPLFDGETAPDGRRFLSGSLGCDDVLRSINGVGGRMFSIRGGQGVQITPVPSEHKLIINIDMQGMALCASFNDLDASDCSDTSDSDTSDDCACGDDPDYSPSSSGSGSSSSSITPPPDSSSSFVPGPNACEPCPDETMPSAYLMSFSGVFIGTGSESLNPCVLCDQIFNQTTYELTRVPGNPCKYVYEETETTCREDAFEPASRNLEFILEFTGTTAEPVATLTINGFDAVLTATNFTCLQLNAPDTEWIYPDDAESKAFCEFSSATVFLVPV